MARIFITGIGGFLGSHLAEALSLRGHSVSGCDSFIGGDMKNIPPNILFHTADCMDLARMTSILQGVDVVYHCAATAHEGFSVFSPLTITRNIYEASVAVFVAAINAKVRRIVFCSSMARYGKQEVPFREDMIPRPQDPYGIAKVAAEETLKVLSQVHGIEYVIAVPHNIYGPRQKYDDPFRNVIGIFINRIMQGKAPIIYGDGSQERCFSYIDDCVEPLMRMLDNRGVVGEVFNIGPDEGAIPICTLAQSITAKMQWEEELIYTLGRPQEVHHAYCSADKARAYLGYETTVRLDEGLDKMIEWMSKEGPKPFKYHLPLEIVNDKTPKTWSEEIM